MHNSYPKIWMLLHKKCSSTIQSFILFTKLTTHTLIALKPYYEDYALEITTFYNDMILSILNISSHDFALGMPTILSSNKVYHRASLEVYVALEQPPLNRGLTPFS